MVHIEVGNVLIHFTGKQKLAEYLKELDSIDVEYYAMLNRGKQFSKDIFLPVTTGTGVNLSFTVDEFYNFKSMIGNYLKYGCQLYADNFKANKMDICLN